MSNLCIRRSLTACPVWSTRAGLGGSRTWSGIWTSTSGSCGNLISRHMLWSFITAVMICTPLAKRNGQFSIYLPFLIHFSLIFHLLTIYFHFFWSQLSQTIYWNHLLAIHTEKCFKMAISFHWFIIYLKNGIETELPLLSSPFSFHFFSRPFFPLKWLFEEAWSTV